MTIVFNDLEQFIDRLIEHHHSKKDDDWDLNIYMCCPGGYINRIPIAVDLIKQYNYTIYVSDASSASLGVLLRLDKNRIKAFDDAHFMDHQLQWSDPKNTKGSWRKTRDYLFELQRQMWEKHFPSEVIDFLCRSPKNGYYFTAQEALKYGIIGEIIPS